MQQHLRFEVLWSPTLADNFISWSTNTNLNLYEVKTVISSHENLLSSSSSSTGIKLNENTVADIVGTNTSTEHRSIKCVAWHPSCKAGPLQQIMAVGHSNGKIALTNFSSSPEINGLLGKEFVPKNSRPLNSLSWNPQFHQFLAAGFDKSGKDHCLYVFDVNKGTPASSLFYERAPLSSSSDLQTAYDWSTGESVNSLEFSLQDPQTLLAGINHKQIKRYDLREAKSVNFLSTKAVQGICMDPLNSTRFASYFENIVHIWDMRNFERPVLTVSDYSNKRIEKLSWCPTRYGFLGCILREHNSMRVFDVQGKQGSVVEDLEPTVIHRSVADSATSPVTAFSWHPTRQNRVIVCYYSGELAELEVLERITVNWSVKNMLVWSQGKRCVQAVEDYCGEALNDASVVMKKRAIDRYGLEKDDLTLNGTMTGDDTLQRLWAWLEEARRLTKDSSFRCPGGGSFKYNGVAALLKQERSSISLRKWIGVEGSKISDVKTFISEERRLSLSLCFWNFEKESSLLSFLNRLEASGQHTRAAAIAVFNLHLSHAIHILQKAATLDPSYHTTAMALAGFTSERQALWRETCSAFLKHISDPYLRTAFAFLTGDADSFDPILNDNGIVVHDRVAFACKYLSDVRLNEFVQSLKEDLVEEANLDGILLTGLNNSEGENLLQRYIDRTGDVQTPALLVVHAMKHITVNVRYQNWVDSYRGMLDSLQLWKERVQLDVLKNQGKDASKLPQQISVSCTYCFKNISSHTGAQVLGRLRNPYDPLGTGATNKLKMTTCPNPACRRALPRCSICLQHMGTPSKRGKNPLTDNSAIPSGDASLQANLGRSAALKQFSNWFTWCHSCRHGGHAQHMMQWFNEHMECPVASCSCKCKRLDDVSKIAPQPKSLSQKL